ncbi:styrene monooxygenase/indole monooxygenase family protein [Legionella tunisiensis]|uniref:styrene monooxygenase/indole monooxygenase family protein n=1 Tax=Legionella tunisiensis TaxID=1034944 RepID=UPI0002D8115E|nr:styrene monooxygenase/indole monooxygenase family protein [Legionella tunisiensis]
MTRKIAIVGAGQSGLQLALGLLANHYKVTLVTEHGDYENGKILSNQVMFDNALQHERDLDIDFWENDAPQNTSVTFTMAKPGTTEIGIQWKGLVKRPFQAVDQRLKFSRWLKKVGKLGGEIVIQTATEETLEELTYSHDLTVIASGKGKLSKLFKRDNERSIHTKPPRILSCLYVNGMAPIPANPGVRIAIIPGVGEYFTVPGLTLNGTCEMMLFEGLPGGPFDCWKDVQSPEQQLNRALDILEKFIPWEAERCAHIKLTDSNATLMGAYIPEVRHPIHQLSSGRAVLGMGDAIVLNDPIAGQGANNASKCARIYMDSIITNQEKPFNELWMQGVFNNFWADAKWSTALSNLLLQSPDPHLIDLLAAASRMPMLADTIANGFNNPKTLFPWVTSPIEIEKMITPA